MRTAVAVAIVHCEWSILWVRGEARWGCKRGFVRGRSWRDGQGRSGGCDCPSLVSGGGVSFGLGRSICITVRCRMSTALIVIFRI